MTADQKLNDLAKMRLVASLIIITIAQPLIYLTNTNPSAHSVVDFTNLFYTYVSLAILVAIYVLVYVCNDHLRSKKDGLIVCKEYSFELFYTVTPLLIINYLLS